MSTISNKLPDVMVFQDPHLEKTLVEFYLHAVFCREDTIEKCAEHFVEELKKKKEEG